MSASSKKKLRKEQSTAQMTERQQKELAESKKLKAYSVAFIAVIVAVVAVALIAFGVNTYNRMGIGEKNTVAATIDGVKLDTVEMGYFFTDAISSAYNQWQSNYGDNTALYVSLMGLDLSQPLNKQTYDPDAGTTWADYFYEVALDDAQSIYGLVKQAEAEGFTLDEEDLKQIDSSMSQMQLYAALYGYTDVDQFLRYNYGRGASVDSYRAYTQRSLLASKFYNAHLDSLTYEDADLREKEKENYNRYSSFDYASYNLSYNSFLEGGTEDENGKVTYTHEEEDAARAAAKETAEALAKSANITELDAAIAALPINAEKENVASVKATDVLYSQLPSYAAEWLSNTARKAGDITVIPLTNTTTHEDGETHTHEDGYCVMVLQEVHDNKRPLGNVRHLLVSFKSESGSSEYTDEEKAAAEATAEALLEQWKSGEATEDSFIALVKENTDDTASAETGGLYENITPTQGVYVEEFTNWAVDESRKPGDTGIIETAYGYHVMYYVGNGELNYRDYLIKTDLQSTDMDTWYHGILDATTVVKGNTSRLNMDRAILAS